MPKFSQVRFYTIFLVFAFFAPIVKSTEENKGQIDSGWYHWDPYQYVSDTGKLEGLDVALVSAILDTSGYRAKYSALDKSSWKDNQDDVLSGRKIIVGGAFETSERKNKYHLTRAYRSEWNSLYVRTNDKSQLVINRVSDMTELIEGHKLRLGVIKGYKYTSDELNEFIEKSLKEGDPWVVESVTEEENFTKLSRGGVDLLVTDRLVGARILWKNKLGSQIVEYPLILPALPIHALVHKSNDPEIDAKMRALVDAFDEGVFELKSNGVIDELIGQYLFPVLMNITVQRNWFYFIDLLGAVFFSIAGLFIARDHRYDIFGTLVMTGLLAVGGGLMRDLLVGRTPMLLRSPDYIYIVGLIGVGGFILLNLHDRLRNHIAAYSRAVSSPKLWMRLRYLIEAIALGAYTIIGVGVAVEMKVSPLWLWGPILGCLTSCGGGVLASALRKGGEEKNFSGGLDPECSLVWGAIFTFFLIWQTNRLDPDEVFLGVVATLVGVTLTLVVCGAFRLQSPCFTYVKTSAEKNLTLSSNKNG